MNTNFKKAGFKDSVNAVRTSVTATHTEERPGKERHALEAVSRLINPMDIVKNYILYGLRSNNYPK